MKKYPILDKLDSSMALCRYQESGLDQTIIDSSEPRRFVKEILGHCDIVVSSETIDYVSVPFFEKVTNGKVFDKLTDLFSEIEGCEGVLLYPESRFSQIRAVSYIIFPKGDENGAMAQLSLYHNEGRVAMLYLRMNGENIDWKGLLSESIRSHPNQSVQQWITNHIQTLFSILTFKQFAEIEVTEIGGKEYPKRLKINKEKYLNESQNTINILDSRWFTKTIRSDGFAVSGHFRLQPYGPNMSKKKLIYIDDFLKHGYTRQARINQSENN